MEHVEVDEAEHAFCAIKKKIVPKSISSYDCAVEQWGPEVHRDNNTGISGKSMCVDLDR